MSGAQSKDFVLTGYAKNLIAFKAWQLSKRRDFSRSDREDLQQELWQAVVSQADRFDPSRASIDTFIDRVVNTAVAMVVRDRERQIRADGFQAMSLDAAARDGDRSRQSLASQITEDDQARRLGRERHDEVAERERGDAVSAALAKMPPEISDVCRRVMGGSISTAAAELKTTRRQIRNSLAIAKSYVEAAGLGNE